MSSREKILRSIRQNLPDSIDLPDHTERSTVDFRDDLADKFAMRLEAIGGLARFFPTREDALVELGQIGDAMNLRDYVRDLGQWTGNTEPDITILEARWAIAENGAVYISDSEVSERSSLFLGQKLIALVDRQDMLVDMHEAYERIDLAAVGFGIFVAGPSATADIAQILVRGAHGPAQMEVWIYQ